MLVQAYPLIIQQVLNELTGDAVIGFGIWTLIAFMVASGCCRIVSWVGLVVNGVKFRSFASFYLTDNVLAEVLKRGSSISLPGSIGEAISRFRDDIKILVDFTIAGMYGLVGSAMYATIGVIIMVQIDALLTVLILSPLVIIFSIAVMAKARVERYRLEARMSTGEVTGFIRDTLSSILTIQVTASEHHFYKRFLEINEIRRKTELKDGLLGTLLGSTYTLVQNLAIGLILVLTGRLIATDQLTIGGFCAICLVYFWNWGIRFNLWKLSYHVQAGKNLPEACS